MVVEKGVYTRGEPERRRLSFVRKRSLVIEPYADGRVWYGGMVPQS